MKQQYVIGQTYESLTHGLLTYKGIDIYYGQETLAFESGKHGMQYFLPETLPRHFKEEQDKVNVNTEIIEAYEKINWCDICKHKFCDIPSEDYDYDYYCLDCNQNESRKKHDNWEAANE